MIIAMCRGSLLWSIFFIGRFALFIIISADKQYFAQVAQSKIKFKTCKKLRELESLQKINHDSRASIIFIISKTKKEP
jgi:hypothetical protein